MAHLNLYGASYTFGPGILLIKSSSGSLEPIFNFREKQKIVEGLFALSLQTFFKEELSLKRNVIKIDFWRQVVNVFLI